MRPKKPRFLDGVQLADNLYTDCRSAPGKYRYKRSDGSFFTFKAATVLEANASADTARATRNYGYLVGQVYHHSRFS